MLPNILKPRSRAWRYSGHRRDHAQGIPQIHRKGCRLWSAASSRCTSGNRLFIDDAQKFSRASVRYYEDLPRCYRVGRHVPPRRRAERALYHRPLSARQGYRSDRRGLLAPSIWTLRSLSEIPERQNELGTPSGTSLTSLRSPLRRRRPSEEETYAKIASCRSRAAARSKHSCRPTSTPASLGPPAVDEQLTWRAGYRALDRSIPASKRGGADESEHVCADIGKPSASLTSIGQDEAVDAVCASIRRSRVGPAGPSASR